jgi:hypothetical protein
MNLGHNYWYHLLASNEFEESWLDEGFTTYTDIQINKAVYVPEADFIDILGVKLNHLQYNRNLYIFEPDSDPTIRNAWDYYSSSSYSTNSYSKAGLILTTLQNYLGQELMLKIMQTYVERWRFKHPTTNDLIQIANEVSNQDLNWYFDQALYSNSILDYSVDEIISSSLEEDKGYDLSWYLFDSGDDPTADSLAHSNSDSTINAAGDIKKEDLYYSEVRIRRLGEFQFPVEVLMVFENGEEIKGKWDGKELWKKFKYTKPSRLAYATVDPGGKIPLDINYTNNSQTVGRQYLGINKITFRALFGVQLIMDQPDLLNLLWRIVRL